MTLCFKPEEKSFCVPQISSSHQNQVLSHFYHVRASRNLIHEKSLVRSNGICLLARHVQFYTACGKITAWVSSNANFLRKRTAHNLQYRSTELKARCYNCSFVTLFSPLNDYLPACPSFFLSCRHLQSQNAVITH